MPEIISRKEAKERGLKRYFTGKPCLRGHVCERLVTGHCIECRRISDNREKARISRRKYYWANREKVSKKNRENYAKNCHKVNERGAVRYLKLSVAYEVLKRMGIEI